MRLTRRQLLRATLAGAASIPLIRALEGVSRASGPTALKNFICIYHPHGIAAEYWALRSGETETSFDVTYDGCSLQPFDDAATYGKSFKDKLLVIEGVDHLSNANGHDSAGTILTGSTISNQKPQNSSLDQFLAVEKGLGMSTPISSIALGVGNDGTASGLTLSFGPGGAPLPKIIDPVEAFNTLFGNLVVPSNPGSQADADRKRKVGQSILDFVTGEIGTLRPRLGVVEQQKLDQHLTSIRELEKRLAPGMAPSSCTVPSMPDATKFPSLKQYNGGEPYFEAITDAHIDVLASAIACGVTQFGTLFMNDLSFMNNPLGLPADNHANVAHTYNASPIGDNNRPGDGAPDTWTPLAKFNRYSYSKVARLMQKLDALGALDNTLIYVSSDMGNPSLHSTQNVPTVLCGGTGGMFKMGRHMRLGPDCSDGTPWCAPGDATFSGVSNNHLLVSIAQAFGVDVNTFGTQNETKHTTGTLSGLT
ncbi:MAG TPA: DUF1552 domain-containing protein [Polyangiaceae bacterium]|jgi:hypothetical protein|nr:DUF1552 domain-containing protein [Polyangiaceae bacterium]